MRQELSGMQKTELNDLLRYSYLLSIYTNLQNFEAKDFGNCVESDAKKKQDYCLTFFDWTRNFPLYSKTIEIQPLCEDLTKKALELDQARDHCAFIIARTYEAYNKFLDSKLDYILSVTLNALNKQLSKAMNEAKADE